LVFLRLTGLAYYPFH